MVHFYSLGMSFSYRVLESCLSTFTQLLLGAATTTTTITAPAGLPLAAINSQTDYGFAYLFFF